MQRSVGSLASNNSFGGGFGGLLANVLGSICGVVFGTVGWAFFLSILVGIAGFAVRGNPLAFFFKEMDAFDADDVGAMTLAVHKSVLLALDKVGINTHAIRLKEQFRAGSRERLI